MHRHVPDESSLNDSISPCSERDLAMIAAENTQTESKTCRMLAEISLYAVRKNPQEPAQTRGNRQKKANPEGLVFPLLVVGADPGSIPTS